MPIKKKSEERLPVDERRGVHPAVREAERIVDIAANWRKAERATRHQRTIAALVLVYGLALWLLSSLCVACILVPAYPGPGLAGILVLSVVGIAAARTWRTYWKSL